MSEKKVHLRQENTQSCENVEDQFDTHTKCDDCGSLTKHKMRCHKRFKAQCEHCSEEYRKKWYAKYKDAWDKMDNPKLVTLTLKKSGDMGKRLEELSSLARRCRFYLKRRGYEIKRHLWVAEPPNHIHALWDCRFIPQHGLSEVWETVTGDSFIVDIRQANTRHGANYLVKYLGKASEWEEMNIDAMEGVHVTGSWGILDDQYEGFNCRDCGSTDHTVISKSAFDHERELRQYRDNPPPWWENSAK